MYRLTLRLSLLGIALALTVLSIAPILTAPVIFYFFGLWSVWIVCACAATPWPGAARLSALWALIDLGLLILFFAMARNVLESPSSGPDGADVAVFIVFLPVIVPSVFLLSYWGVALPSVDGLLESTLGHYRANLVDAWLVMSVIAAMQCCVLVLVSRAVRSVLDNRASNQRLERP